MLRQLLTDPVRDQNVGFTILGFALESCGHVDRIANCRELLFQLKANFPDHNRAIVNPDPNLEPVSGPAGRVPANWQTLLHE